MVVILWYITNFNNVEYFNNYYSYNQFKMRNEMPCKVVCRAKFDAAAAKNFKEKIDDEYRVNM